MIKAIVFDCDGTLVDSETLGNEVLVEYLAELGHSMQAADAVTIYTGIRMDDCVADLERRFECAMPINFVTNLRERMTHAFSRRLQPMPGAAQLLTSISMPTYVASSGPTEKIVHSLTVAGLIGFFGPTHIFSAYEVGCWKPDPGFYSVVAEQIGTRTNEMIVIEDSKPGILAALRAGAVAIAVHGDDPVISGVTHAPTLCDVRPWVTMCSGLDGKVPLRAGTEY